MPKCYMEILLSGEKPPNKGKEKIQYLYELIPEKYDFILSFAKRNNFESTDGFYKYCKSGGLLTQIKNYLENHEIEYRLWNKESSIICQSWCLRDVLINGTIQSYNEKITINNKFIDVQVQVETRNIELTILIFRDEDTLLDSYDYKFTQDYSPLIKSKEQIEIDKKEFKASKGTCKVCDRQLYFDTEWYHADAGYGDDDYGGKTQNIVSSFICPACGKIKCEIATKMFGSINKALLYLYIQNMGVGMTLEDAKKDLAQLWEEVDEQHLKTMLEENKLTFEDGTLTHKCGHKLLTNVKPNIKVSLLKMFEDILIEKNVNFCPCCGKRILPFKTNIGLIPDNNKLGSFAGKSIKTWDRSERR